MNKVSLDGSSNDGHLAYFWGLRSKIALSAAVSGPSLIALRVVAAPPISGGMSKHLQGSSIGRIDPKLAYHELGREQLEVDCRLWRVADKGSTLLRALEP